MRRHMDYLLAQCARHTNDSYTSLPLGRREGIDSVISAGRREEGPLAARGRQGAAWQAVVSPSRRDRRTTTDMEL
jgi:hypothetical protein